MALAWSFEAIPPRWRRLGLFALSVGGVAFTLLILVVGYQDGQFRKPSDYTTAFDPAGDTIRAGGNPYASGPPYSPPVLLAFAAISWLPVPVGNLLLLGAELLALRYIVGSWIGVGIVGWCPLLPFELVLGNINLLVGACIVGAVRGHGWAGVAGGLMKFSPILAIREWRSAAVALLVGLIVTLPWLGMWADWVHLLLSGTGVVVGPVVPVPWQARAAVAAALLLVRRPTATALACVLAIPVFHYQTLLLLIVPLAVWMRARQRVPESGPEDDGSSRAEIEGSAALATA